MTAKSNSVQCTHCGAHTPNNAIWRTAHIDIVGDAAAQMVSNNIQVVRCAACEEEILVEISSSKAVWPLATGRVPEGVPSMVDEAYSDAMLALAAGSKIGALMAMRTMGERLLRDRNMGSFSELACKGVITHALYGIIDQNRLWANTFGHESIRTERIELVQIAELFEFVRTVLETIYTHPLAAKRLSKRTKEFQQGTSQYRS